jgi:hypothetical protein
MVGQVCYRTVRASVGRSANHAEKDEVAIEFSEYVDGTAE